ncbi:hypothetical protein [Amycolatopsis sp. NPDC003861]
MAIVAVTESGEERVRVWRCVEPLTARATADRVRWQCEGWLTAIPGDRPSSGIGRLRLVPEELVGGEALQLQLGAMGRDEDAAERAGRAMVRIQGLLGPEAVLTPLLDGGRTAAERVRLIPWGDALATVTADAPWPRRLPVPSPAIVPRRTISAAVHGAGGQEVRCTMRGELIRGREPAVSRRGGSGPDRGQDAGVRVHVRAAPAGHR